MNILIVDDEPMVRASMARMLRELGEEFRVREAEDGEEALELLQEEKTDLMIADIRMPALDGLQLTDRVIQQYSDTEIVLLTGYAEFEYAVEALRKGVSEYLLKPVSKDTIAGLVRKIRMKQEERKSKAKVEQLRNTNVLEKSVHHLLYGIPIPVYNRELLPEFSQVEVFTLTADQEALWEQPVRFFIKNVLQDALSPKGVPVIPVEERLLAVVWFVKPDSSIDHSDRERLLTSTLKEMESMIRTPIQTGRGGSSSRLEDIGLLFMRSLKELGLWKDENGQDSVGIHYLIRSSLEWMREQYHTPLTLNGLADKLYVNPNYLSTLFKKETGLTFTQQLVRIRIEAAKRLLTESNLKIYEICKQIGYVDQAHFSRTFKALEGMSPYDYRNSRFRG